MAEVAYIREYFTENAAEWVQRAYQPQRGSAGYPLGPERVSAAIDALLERHSPPGDVLDLGCGAGQLCFEAARLGFTATGVDVAEGMIRLCKAGAQNLPEQLRERLYFAAGEVLHTELPDASFDAITALGLIEYLPDDDEFLRECVRLLRPGGSLIVTCRNRLFNLASLNQYTKRELERGEAGELLDELSELCRVPIPPAAWQAWVRNLNSLGPMLAAAARRDSQRDADRPVVSTKSFAQNLRQHTPREIIAAAERFALSRPSVVSIHPHPLPPMFEASAPHAYNALACAMQVLAAHPASLAWSSCFQVTLTRE